MKLKTPEEIIIWDTAVKETTERLIKLAEGICAEREQQIAEYPDTTMEEYDDGHFDGMMLLLRRLKQKLAEG